MLPKPRPVLAALLLALLPGVAVAQDAQPKCFPFAGGVHALQVKHGETPILKALTSGGNLVVIFANPDRTSWTALAVSPKGVACPLQSGTSLEIIEQPPPGQPS